LVYPGAMGVCHSIGSLDNKIYTLPMNGRQQSLRFKNAVG